MTSCLNILVFSFAFYYCIDQSSIDASRFKLTNFVCDSVDSSFLTLHTCRLKAVKRDKTILNFNATLHQTINKARIHSQMFKKANGFKPWLYNISLDLCKFLKKPFGPPMVLIFNIIKPYTNFNHTCPYSGSLQVVGFYLIGEQMPLPLPSGEYKIVSKFYYDSTLVISIALYFSFEENLL